MKPICAVITIAALMLAAVSCDKSSRGTETPDEPEPPKGFQDTVKVLSGYPQGMTVKYFKDYFKADTALYCSGYAVEVDFAANPKLRFNAVHLPSPAKPSAAFAAFDKTKGTPLICTNAGYWWAGQSLSLLISDGEVKSIAANYAYVTVNGSTQTVYPVRAALGLMPSGGFEATWVYCCMDDNQRPYSFPSALANNEKSKSYLRIPPNSKSSGAQLWSPVEAAGGGPMLVKGGRNVAEFNYWREILDEGGTAGLSRQPRTAVGVTAEGKMIIIVCDGRNQNGSKGYTLPELADIFLDAGCVEAVNYDGGGSSTIVGRDGAVLNRPSDSYDSDMIIERSVSTAIVISQKE